MRIFCSVLGLFLLFSVLAQSQAADSIVVYSGRSDKFVKPIAQQFSQETGIQVILHTGKSVALLNKLRIEKERTEADLFLSNDAGTLQKGSEFNLWEKLPKVVTEVIHSNYRAPDNTWVGLSARARVLVINKDRIKPESVSSVFDLAQPRFKGRLAITNSANESYISGTTVYLMAKGAEVVEGWLKGMKANVDGHVFNKHSKIVKAVASGKKDIGLVNHYYIYRHLAKSPDAPIRIVIPDQKKSQIGVAWNVTGIALVKHSKNKKLATQFVQYLVSVQGQKMFADANKEYPTRKGVAADPSVPKMGSFKVADVPMVELGTQRSATIDLIEKVGMP